MSRGPGPGFPQTGAPDDEPGKRLQQRVAANRQAGLRHMVKASLLVTSGLIPTNVAAQSLVG